jgi:hypothetical protein
MRATSKLITLVSYSTSASLCAGCCGPGVQLLLCLLLSIELLVNVCLPVCAALMVGQAGGCKGATALLNIHRLKRDVTILEVTCHITNHDMSPGLLCQDMRNCIVMYMTFVHHTAMRALAAECSAQGSAPMYVDARAPRADHTAACLHAYLLQAHLCAQDELRV